jgi:parallel beta-helix repeat protein
MIIHHFAAPIALTLAVMLSSCGTPNATDTNGDSSPENAFQAKAQINSAGGNGLNAEYFDTQNFSGPSLKRLEPNLNFNWANGSPASSIGPDTFSARYTGDLIAPSTGTYTFYATSDDGERLYIDGRPVLSDFETHWARTTSGTINLIAGKRVPIRLEYFENTEGASLKLEWSGPGVTRQVIPTAQLFGIAPVAPPISTGAVFFIAPTGNDDNPGSEASPWKTIHKAVGTLKAGETVLIKNGTYLGGLYIQRSGAPGKPITYKAFPGARPIIEANQPTSGAFFEGVSYVNLEGLDFEYTAPGAEAANGERGEGGIMIQDSPAGAHSHHIAITNNRVHNFPGGGIGSNLSDYISIVGNTVWENALWSKYDGSGISLYRSLNVDSAGGYHNVIRGNTVFNNENRVPDYKNKAITDGNCIIIDDSRNTQHELGDPLKDKRYTGATLIENNICSGNGGGGVRIYSSDNVLARHNTLFRNQITTTINAGEMTAYDASNVRFVNNIVYATAGKRANGTGNATNIVYERNLYFGTTDIPMRTSSDLIGDPFFEAPSSNLTSANFRLRSGSPAIDSALTGQSPATDFAGRARPLGIGPDLGAWESR